MKFWKPSTRLWQFRLATLLVVLTLLAIVSAAYGNHQRRLARQTKAFEEIAAKGGGVLHYQEGAFITFVPRGFGLACGTGLVKTYQPSVTIATFGDNDLKLLDDVINLNSIDFKGSRVSADGIAKFTETHPNSHVAK